MKRLVVVLASAIAFAHFTISNAAITNVWLENPGSVQWTRQLNGENATIWMTGTQTETNWQVFGGVETDSLEDPVLTLNGTVLNNTTGAWVGYQINVLMSIPFTFVAPGPSVANPPTNDWYVWAVWQPWWTGTEYKGTLWFSAGTPVPVGDSLEYIYSIDFSGTLGFQFCTQMIPWFTPIPEPSSFVLAGLGGLAMLAMFWRFKRNN